MKSAVPHPITGKRLRYAMELLAGAFPSDFRDTHYVVVEMLQDKLGKINDLATAQVRLSQQIEEAVEPADSDELRRLRASESARLEQAQREFLDWCTPDFLKGIPHGVRPDSRKANKSRYGDRLAVVHASIGQPV